MGAREVARWLREPLVWFLASLLGDSQPGYYELPFTYKESEALFLPQIASEHELAYTQHIHINKINLLEYILMKIEFHHFPLSLFSPPPRAPTPFQTNGLFFFYYYCYI